MFVKQPCVYILASQYNGTLYVGVTSHLAKRLWEHRMGFVKGFSCEYKVHNLVWYEVHSVMYDAITREKRIKKWKRDWKIELIESVNPDWKDLRFEIF